MIATLAAGRRTLRVTVQGVASPPFALTVKPASAPRVTSAPDNGDYRGTTLSTSFRIAGAGRTIQVFRATVTMLCPQVGLPGGQGQLTTRAGFAQSAPRASPRTAGSSRPRPGPARRCSCAGRCGGSSSPAASRG